LPWQVLIGVEFLVNFSKLFGVSQAQNAASVATGQ
jgi:hypothetical protein